MAVLRPQSHQYGRDVNRYLIAGERVEIATRLHIIVVAKPVAVFVAALIFTVYVAATAETGSPLTDLLILAVIVLGIRALLKLDWWRRQWFIVTDIRMMLVSNFVGHSISAVNNSRVTHHSYHRTIPGHLLGYSHFIFQSAGRDIPLYTVKFVPGGRAVYRAVVSVITTGGLEPETQVEEIYEQFLEDDPTSRLALPRAAARKLRAFRRYVPEPPPSSVIGARHEPLEDTDRRAPDDENDDDDY